MAAAPRLILREVSLTLYDYEQSKLVQQLFGVLKHHDEIKAGAVWFTYKDKGPYGWAYFWGAFKPETKLSVLLLSIGIRGVTRSEWSEIASLSDSSLYKRLIDKHGFYPMLTFSSDNLFRGVDEFYDPSDTEETDDEDKPVIPAKVEIILHTPCVSGGAKAQSPPALPALRKRARHHLKSVQDYFDKEAIPQPVRRLDFGTQPMDNEHEE